VIPVVQPMVLMVQQVIPVVQPMVLMVQQVIPVAKLVTLVTLVTQVRVRVVRATVQVRAMVVQPLAQVTLVTQVRVRVVQVIAVMEVEEEAEVGGVENNPNKFLQKKLLYYVYRSLFYT